MVSWNHVLHVLHFIFIILRNLLRVTQAAALESTSGSGSKQLFLGKKGKDFTFEDLRRKVDFVECFARSGKDCDQADLGKLESWLTTLV